MGNGTWVLLGIAVVAVLTACALGLALLRERHRAQAEVARLRTDGSQQRQATDVLEQRLKSLTERVAELHGRDADGYLITSAGREEPLVSRGHSVSDQLVLSATLGEPLVRTLALAHGVRRGLSAPARNRIRFAARQATRTARKERRADLRAALRQVRAERREAS